MSLGLIPRQWVEFQMSMAAPTPETFHALLVDAGLDPDKSHYAPTELKVLLVRAVLLLQDEYYGHSNLSLPIGSMNLLLSIMHSGHNLRDAMNILKDISTKISPQQWVDIKYVDDDCIFSIIVNGRDEEHSAAVELNGILIFLFAMQAFVGQKFHIKKLYSRSTIYTGFMDYNQDGNCPVEYGELTGFQLDVNLLDLPRRSTFETSALSNAIRWGLFIEKGAGRGNTDGKLRIEAELILQRIEKRAISRNIGVRQKRRIALEESNVSLRDLKRNIKAANAILLISTTDKSMGEIATEIGLSDERAFRRFFQGSVGCTPHEYRKLHSAERNADGKDIFSVIMDGVQKMT